MKIIRYKILIGNISRVIKYFQTSQFGISVIAIGFLLITLIPHNQIAQDLFSSSSNKNHKFSFSNDQMSKTNIKPYMFDRLTLKLLPNNSLFSNGVSFNFKDYFRKVKVQYSLNSRLIYDVDSKDYSSTSYLVSDTAKAGSEQVYYDLDKFNSNLDLLQSALFLDSFINNVVRNQFFYDMYTKQNDIFTNEFSILDFQSTQSNQYLEGTKIWGGIGVGMVGVLMLMPRSVTKWEEGYIDDASANLKRAFSEPPVWDEDHWEINYIGHPYAGCLYYNTIRSQGGSMLNSFLFSAFVSTGWEYLYEGVAERPSIQDLFVTPVAGAILGELIHQSTLGMKKNGYSIFEAAFVTLFNPMYVITNGYN